MTTSAEVLTPGVHVEDVVAQHWMRQAVVRLRREVTWQQHLRRGRLRRTTTADLDGLDLVRYAAERTRFFTEDATAAYLTDLLSAEAPTVEAPRRGTFAWLRSTLDLDDAAAFVLALALLPMVDGAAGASFGVCLGDERSTLPTLQLAQRLWDTPSELRRLSSRHVLFTRGILRADVRTPVPFERPLFVPEALVGPLLFGDDDSPYPTLTKTETPSASKAPRRPRDHGGASIVRVDGYRGSAFGEVVAGLTEAPRVVIAPRDPIALPEVCTYAWCVGADVLLHASELGAPIDWSSVRDIPVMLWVTREEGRGVALPQDLLAGGVDIPRTDYAGRVALWSDALEAPAADAIGEVARRFRFEPETIRRVARSLSSRTHLMDACRAEVDLEFGDLAERVEPRFGPDDIVLDASARRLFDEVLNGMRRLTEVHYTWGLGKVWNEAGLATLFAGPSGTGKTMAAECLAMALDLPMYRVDLSQVISKWVGETEKNLRTIFDTADSGDIVLFFDEADALFGKRGDVRTGQDRWSNLEVSYLLSRMERARGLTVLATNRKADFDPAFLRRLRYIVDFPNPRPRERARIWKKCLPKGVDCSTVDVPFLAERFTLTGGQIRSAMFNASLQSARGAERPTLSMEAVVIAVKRELDKHELGANLNQFEPYGALVRELETPDG
ncbi:MAG: AAA family ATPase [Deltaproteobacteria bacterium]